MACKCARFDAAGNRILPHADMIVYYKDDPESLNIVKRSMPFKYVVIPAIEIFITRVNTVVAVVYVIYPGETKDYTVNLSAASLGRLRWFYGHPGRWTVDTSKPDRFIFRRKGKVIFDPKKRFGPKRSSL